MNWATGYDEGDDEFKYGLFLDYGIAPMHQLLFELPVDIGDGGTDGNGDVRFGWHWQLLKETDCAPSIAMRNYVRLPTGYQSSGVDYELRGLFTKSVSDCVRIHANPFLKSVNGDNTEDVRYFQWGGVFGADWRITDKLDLVFDYVVETSEVEELRCQHSVDAGFSFEVAPHHKIGLTGSMASRASGSES
jgi:hypothetical protein